MPFKVNCENCEGLLIKGEVYNHKGKYLCEDCYVLHYLFDLEAPSVDLPEVPPGSKSSRNALKLSAKS